MSLSEDKTIKGWHRIFGDTKSTSSQEPKSEVTIKDLEPLRKAIINLSNEAKGISDRYRELEEGIGEHNKKFQEQEESIKKQTDNFNTYADEIKNLKKDLENQKNRIPEIVGLFSAIIALVLIDVSIIKSAQSFLESILLICALTCSIIIFAVLIHLFFAPADKIKFGRLFWVPILILVGFIFLGIILDFLNIDINKTVAKDIDNQYEVTTMSTSTLPTKSN